jgi:hypothetical protein
VEVSWPILRYFSDTPERTVDSTGNRKVGSVVFRRHCLLSRYLDGVGFSIHNSGSQAISCGLNNTF